MIKTNSDLFLHGVEYTDQGRLVFEEMLSSPDDIKLLASKQIFHEVCIEELDDCRGLGFVVKHNRLEWSEVDHRIMWQEISGERWPNLTHAKLRFATQLQELRARGFTRSDMKYLTANATQWLQ